jgi:putative ABC transport system permease protein
VSWFPRVRFRLHTLLGRAWLEEQLDEEVQFHLDMQAAAHVRLGLSPVAARALARREFGSIAQHKDDYRDRWGIRHLETVVQDLRLGVRHAMTERITSLAIIVALALGVGVSTAVFSVFDAVLLQPPPFAEPDRLVRLQAAARGGERLFSAPEIRDLRQEALGFSGLAEFHFMYFILLDAQEPRRVSAGVVSANFFEVAGVQPAAGRAFLPSEELVGAPGVIILSHRFWTEQLSADPDVIGREFRMNDRVHTVVGVLPPLPSFPEAADIYLPTSACPLRMSDEGNLNRTSHLVSALGRVSGAGASGLLTINSGLSDAAGRIAARFPATYAEAEPFTVSAVAVNDDLIWRFRPTLSVLLASAGFLVLSLCSSVGALLLARSVRRRRSVAMQLALGAWRGRLFQQFVTEALLLTTAGALAGVALASQSLPLLVSLAARYTSRANEIELNESAVLFALGVSVLVGVVCGGIVTIAAAPSVSRPDPLVGGRDVARDPVFRTLIVLQIAVSFALLVGAGLTFKSLNKLAGVDTGYRSHDVVTMRVSTDFIKYPTLEHRAALYDALLREVRAVPDVTAAAISGALPFVDSGNVGEVDVDSEVRQGGGPDAGIGRASLQTVSADYFRTVGLDLIAGRPFNADDSGSASRPAIINRAMATRRWPAGAAVGQHLRLDRGEPRTVVGVVSDARQRLNESPMEEVFVPIRQLAPVQARLFVRTTLPPGRIESILRDAVRRAEPEQPIDSLLTLDDARDQSVAAIRVTATLIGAFALIGVTISLIGVAGVVSASVQATVGQLGLRMALGATRTQVLLQVLGEGVRLAALGTALGLVLAAVMSRALRSLLFEVPPHDVTIYGTVGALLLALTLAACFIPARRAALVDPCVALRVG